MNGRTNSDLRPGRSRVFGIGLNKTGTSSFDKAMTILGFQSLHDGGPEIHHAVQCAIDDRAPLLSNLDPKFDTFSDIGLLSRRFRLLDCQYPGSRFVLTMRPFNEWLHSRTRHVQRNIALRDAGEYDGSFVVIDEEKWTNEWDLHMTGVHTYFAGRADLLEVDFTNNAEWGPLCAFLGVDEPVEPFPWVNRDRALHAPDAERNPEAR